MKTRLIFPALVLAVVTVPAQSTPEVEITAEPTIT
jgi:hypothetical protein